MDPTPIRELVNAWPVVVGAVGLVVWLVRLEGRVSQVDKDCAGNEKRFDNLQIRHEALDSKVVMQLADVRESLARIEGALGVRKPEMENRF